MSCFIFVFAEKKQQLTFLVMGSLFVHFVYVEMFQIHIYTSYLEWKNNEPANRPAGLCLQRYNVVTAVNHGMGFNEKMIFFYSSKNDQRKLRRKKLRINCSIERFMHGFFFIKFVPLLNFSTCFFCLFVRQ